MMHPSIRLFFFLAFIAACGLDEFACAGELRAGAAAVDITPQRLPLSMTGSFQDRQATGAHDRLHARCLVLDDGGICVANGYNGYLPTPEQHALGGYETWRSGWSYLEESASRKITEALIKMLEVVSDAR